MLNKKHLSGEITKLITKISKENIFERYPALIISKKSIDILENLPHAQLTKYSAWGEFKKDDSSNIYTWTFQSYPRFFMANICLNKKEIYNKIGIDSDEVAESLKEQVNNLKKMLTKKQKLSLIISLTKFAENKNDHVADKIDSLIYILAKQIDKEL